MTEQERNQAKALIKFTLDHLTDEERKAILVLTITRETCDGAPITEI